MIGVDINIAKKYLEAGELVAIPTETVYGLAGNGLNLSAISEIFAVKNRPSFDPLILHTDSIEKVQALVSEFPDQAIALSQNYGQGLLPFSYQKNQSSQTLPPVACPK